MVNDNEDALLKADEAREIEKLKAAQRRAVSSAVWAGWAATTLGNVMEQAANWGGGVVWMDAVKGEDPPLRAKIDDEAAKWAKPARYPNKIGTPGVVVIVDIDVSVRRDGWSITAGPLIAARGQAIREYCEQRSEHLCFVAFAEISGLPHVRVGLRAPAKEQS